MTRSEIVGRAFEVFAADARPAPPLSLRGGHAVDGYTEAEPFDATLDEPTDEYLERFTFWGLGYLDGRSWRHYLPRLIDYAFRRPDDPSMVVEAMLRSLRPPDRYPPRLTTLTTEQEATIVAFLETVAFSEDSKTWQNDARLALEEWWWPGARHRRSPTDVSPVPVAFRLIERPLYRLELPETFASSGARDVPEETRTVEVWHGLVGGEVPAVAAVNVTPRSERHLGDIVARAARGLRAASVQARDIMVTGARGAYRADGLTRGDSPVEPQSITIVAAHHRAHVVLLSVRRWPRADVDAAMERVVGSLALAESADGV